MNTNDILLYKEALAACGWTTIRTDGFERLQNIKRAAQKVIREWKKDDFLMPDEPMNILDEVLILEAAE